jgi:hypothetical protein
LSRFGADLRTQQQAGAPATAGGPVQSGPEGRSAPQPSGLIPADAAIQAAPEARLTLSGSNFGAALPAPCPSPTPAAAAGTAHNTPLEYPEQLAGLRFAPRHGKLRR